ncbi:Rv3654c family TadE-like protein [Candidatus Mycobacterium methanotrophicum]|uniref:Rv3654c family TadE-like protein n=1 Tax=Candidatus Mycobacterium methanotrophicum TaxID=2943498 RepID=UPI0027D94478|nr:Rv3654c family TadE-like protein [Candidatus Mycobacterium methanotrophicum]
MAAVLLSIAGGGVYLGSAVVARHRAQAAADLAALAAAARLAAGPETACAQAKAVASKMRVDTTGCVVEDLDVVVTTEVRLAVGGWGKARAAARAGPADRVQSPHASLRNQRGLGADHSLTSSPQFTYRREPVLYPLTSQFITLLRLQQREAAFDELGAASFARACR